MRLQAHIGKRGSIEMNGTLYFAPYVQRCAMFFAVYLLLHAGLAVASTSVYVNRELGFSIHHPKNWVSVPVHEDEKYVLTAFRAPNRLRTKKARSWKDVYYHTPEMKIVAFAARTSEPDTEKNKEMVQKKETVLGRTIFFKSRKKRFSNFQEFSKTDLRGKEYFLTPARKSTVHGIGCTYMDVVLEKTHPPLIRLSCTYHLDGHNITVFFEIMADWKESYAQTFHRMFISFSTIAMKKALKGSGYQDIGTQNDSSTRTGFIHKKKESLGKGWRATESKHFLLLSNADARAVKSIAGFADAIYKKIRQEFAAFEVNPKSKPAGNRAETIPPVIRICANRGELGAFIHSTNERGYYNPDSREVVVFDGVRDGLDAQDIYTKVGRGVFRQFFAHTFRFVQPCPWMGAGMDFYFSCFKKRGRGCRYKHDSRAEELLKKARTRGICRSLKAMLHPETGEVSTDENYWKVGFLFCFLKSGYGKKGPWNGVVERYLSRFHRSCEEITQETLGHNKKPGSTTVQSKTKGKDLQSWILDKRDFARQQAFEAAFAGWDDADWVKLEKAFWKWMM